MYNNNTLINQSHISFYNEYFHIALPLKEIINNPCDNKIYEYLKKDNNLCFYYYTLQSPEIYLTYFLRYSEYWAGDNEDNFNEEHWRSFINKPLTLQSLRYYPLILPIIIFKDEAEKDKFLQFIKSKYDDFENYINLYIHNNDNFHKKYNRIITPHIVTLENIRDENKENSYWIENAYQSALFAYWTYNIYWNEFKNYKSI